MIVNPHHELILLAAEMAQGTGLPSEFPEDRGFCKTTPVKERRRIIAELELSRQTARVWAQRVRAAADLLAAENAALRARLDELQSEHDAVCRSFDRAHEACVGYEKRLAETGRDAERWRFFCKRSPFIAAAETAAFDAARGEP